MPAIRFARSASSARRGRFFSLRCDRAGPPNGLRASGPRVDTLESMPQLGSLEKALRFGEGRRLKRLREQADYIATLEPDFEKLTPAELQAKPPEFRLPREHGEPLDDRPLAALAAVREARKRASDQRLFDVQMMGGIVLHEGDIAEMKTGEGKTYVASLALYLNALAGLGVHLVTVNDY